LNNAFFGLDVPRRPAGLPIKSAITPGPSDGIVKSDALWEGSVDREKHLEAALQHLRGAIALLTAAGEDRLAPRH
jgi:hypothetical protein